jgi:hypothetical protein
MIQSSDSLEALFAASILEDKAMRAMSCGMS